MRRRRERMALNAEINVVSLIDVMMLLMVIFMITAPIMQGGLDINLPKAEAKPLEPKSGLVVTIDRTAVFTSTMRRSHTPSFAHRSSRLLQNVDAKVCTCGQMPASHMVMSSECSQ
jgi:Biopolymer transport protein